MKVKALPHNPGPAAWNAILPKQDSLPSLSAQETVDWLVIGAGFAGLSAARRLQIEAPNDRIIILEAKGLAEGPAGRNSGFMIDLPHDLTSDDYGGQIDKDRITIAQNRLAIDFARDMVETLHLPSEAFREVGKINAAASEKGLKHNGEYAAHLNNLGEPHAVLDAQEMQEITGISYYQGGLFTPGAVMLQPALYIRSLGAKLLSNRLRIYEHSPVVALQRKDGLWQAKTPKGSIRAPKVILAVNGHVENFGQFSRQLVHVFTYASMTRALSSEDCAKLGGHPDWGLTPADPLGTTVRRISGDGGDRIIVRNRFTYEPSMMPSARVQKSVYRTHIQSFAARFPMLKSVAMEYQWGGHLTLSLNNVAAFGEVEDGLFSACCQNGLGTVKGTLHGLAAADLAMGRDNDLIRQLQSAPAPKHLPPEPIATLGAALRLRWGELRAGKEL